MLFCLAIQNKHGKIQQTLEKNKLMKIIPELMTECFNTLAAHYAAEIKTKHPKASEQDNENQEKNTEGEMLKRWDNA